MVGVRTLAAACLLALILAGCGGGDAAPLREAEPTLTDPASVPTAVADPDREPYQIGPGGAYAPGDAPAITATTTEPQSTTYTVIEGDTCGGIARQFGISLGELLEANPRINEDCTNLNIGAELNIPPSTATPTPSPDSGGVRRYVVIEGDTCAAIAEDHRISLQTLLVANGLDEESCRTLQAGDSLIIPDE